MAGDSRPTVTFYVSGEVRTQIEDLSASLSLTMRNLVFSAITHYAKLLGEGAADRPRTDALTARQRRVTVYDQGGLGAWMAKKADEWKTTRGTILAKAIGHYASAIEAGQISRPERDPKHAEQEAAHVQRTKPKLGSKPGPKPVRKNAPVDRAGCPVCLKQAVMDSATGLLGKHIADPSVRARGEYKLCEGTGQAPAGPVIHSAEIALSARRNI